MRHAKRAGGSPSSGDDKTVRLWDARSGEEFALLGGREGTVSKLSFSADGRWLAAAAFGSISVWDLHRVREFFKTPPARLAQEAEYRASLSVDDLDIVPVRPNTSSPYEERAAALADSGEEIQPRLAALAVELRGDPTATGYVIVYGSPVVTTQSTQLLMETVRNHLVNKLGIDAKRIAFIYGGLREAQEVELWLVPRGAIPP